MHETMVDFAQENESHSIDCFAWDVRRVRSWNAPRGSCSICTGTQRLEAPCQSRGSGISIPNARHTVLHPVPGLGMSVHIPSMVQRKLFRVPFLELLDRFHACSVPSVRGPRAIAEVLWTRGSAVASLVPPIMGLNAGDAFLLLPPRMLLHTKCLYQFHDTFFILVFTACRLASFLLLRLVPTQAGFQRCKWT